MSTWDRAVYLIVHDEVFFLVTAAVIVCAVAVVVGYAMARLCGLALRVALILLALYLVSVLAMQVNYSTQNFIPKAYEHIDDAVRNAQSVYAKANQAAEGYSYLQQAWQRAKDSWILSAVTTVAGSNNNNNETTTKAPPR